MNGISRSGEEYRRLLLCEELRQGKLACIQDSLQSGL